jgi:phosphate transport system substrate-binding protein
MKTRQLVWAVAVTAVLSLIAPSSPAPAAPADRLQINAAGATFPYPIYSKWFDEFHKTHSNVEINYQSIGSGGGIKQLQAGTVDFGASDKPLDDKQMADFKVHVYHFPTVLGAVVPSYNIPGLNTELKFTPAALAGIYLGKIRKWNDPELTKSNPGVNLPGDEIVVIHRSDGSGTTFVWTDYLSKVSPEWKSKVGSNTSVNWPVGLGGKGNEGVAGTLSQTPNAIGYVELIYAIQNHMSYGSVQNAAGKFVKADLAGVTGAAAAKSMPSDFRVSITDAPGASAYPIASFTYLLIPEKIADSGKRDAIKEFLRWMIKDGQKDCAGLSYAPLPHNVAAAEEKQIDKVQ